MSKGWKYVTPGLPDNLFQKDGIPLTKEEVRCLAVCKARLERNSVVYDIGAGTGSLAIEAALLVVQGVVYAVERNPHAVAVARENAQRWGLKNLHFVEGEAPEALSALPPADRVFLGGSGGRLEEVLRAVSQQMKPRGRLVATAATVETLSTLLRLLPELGFATVEAVLLQVARLQKAGQASVWKGMNPVYLVVGERH